MKRTTLMSAAALAILALSLFVLAGCKTSGMAVTSRGQLLKINIKHPIDLPDNGEDDLDVDVSNRGVKSVQNVMVDVELPPQLIVVDETHGRGLNPMHDPSSNVYHYTLSSVQPGEDAVIHYKVRTAFGTMSETGSVKVTAWQTDLPGDKLVETAVIRLRR